MKTNWLIGSLMALTPPTGEKVQAHGKYTKTYTYVSEAFQGGGRTPYNCGRLLLLHC